MICFLVEPEHWNFPALDISEPIGENVTKLCMHTQLIETNNFYFETKVLRSRVFDLDVYGFSCRRARVRIPLGALKIFFSFFGVKLHVKKHYDTNFEIMTSFPVLEVILRSKSHFFTYYWP